MGAGRVARPRAAARTSASDGGLGMTVTLPVYEAPVRCREVLAGVLQTWISCSLRGRTARGGTRPADRLPVRPGRPIAVPVAPSSDDRRELARFDPCVGSSARAWPHRLRHAAERSAEDVRGVLDRPAAQAEASALRLSRSGESRASGVGDSWASLSRRVAGAASVFRRVVAGAVLARPASAVRVSQSRRERGSALRRPAEAPARPSRAARSRSPTHRSGPASR